MLSQSVSIAISVFHDLRRREYLQINQEDYVAALYSETDGAIDFIKMLNINFGS